MTNIVKFNGTTRNNLDPDTVLENTKGNLKGFIIAGYDKNNEYFFSSTYADGRDALWLAEQFKAFLLSDAGGE